MHMFAGYACMKMIGPLNIVRFLQDEFLCLTTVETANNICVLYLRFTRIGEKNIS